MTENTTRTLSLFELIIGLLKDANEQLLILIDQPELIEAETTILRRVAHRLADVRTGMQGTFDLFRLREIPPLVRKHPTEVRQSLLPEHLRLLSDMELLYVFQDIVTGPNELSPQDILDIDRINNEFKRRKAPAPPPVKFP